MKFLATIMAFVVSAQLQAAVCKIPAYDQLNQKYDAVLERVSVGGGVIESGLKTGRMILACIVMEDLMTELNQMDKEFNSMLALLADPATTEKYAKICGMTQDRMNNLSQMTKEITENNLGIIDVIKEYQQACK